MSEALATTPQRAEPAQKRLPALLRGLGAAAVLFSLYSFLVQGWSGSSDLLRYLVLLGHTGLLALVALTSARYLGDSKGPRVLLGLALVSVTANFAVLGGFLYAAVMSIGQPDIPAVFLWNGLDLTQATLLIAASMVVLAPVSAIGFRTLIRALGKPMTALFLASNAVLLIPVRDTQLSALVVMVFGVLVLWLSMTLTRRRIEVNTWEGLTAILLQFLPLLVVLGRICWIYAADALAILALVLLLYGCCRQCALLLDRKSGLRRLLELASAVLALVAGCCVFVVAADALDLVATAAALVACLVTAAVLYELSTRAAGSQAPYRVIAGNILVLGTLLSCLAADGGGTATLALLAGACLLIAGCRFHNQSLLAGGLLMAVVGAISLLLQMLQVFDFGSWLGLALVGIGAIVVASVLESGDSGWSQRLRTSVREYRQWQW